MQAAPTFVAKMCRDVPPHVNEPSLVIVQLLRVNGRLPAYEAGLRVLDRVVTVSGCRPSSEAELASTMGSHSVGGAAEVTVFRLGRRGGYDEFVAMLPIERGKATASGPASCQRVGLREGSLDVTPARALKRRGAQ